MVGRYVVVARLGAGAMGVVYAAFDPELSRQVALKVVRVPGGDDHAAATYRLRLQREAQAMARLTHRNTVAVYDVGVAGGAVFLAMELVRGANLRQWLGEQPRTLAAIADVFVAAAHGLWAAHRQDLVHRDFKPENVLVGTDPRGPDMVGRVCVGDFGLAAAAPSTGHQDDATAVAGPLSIALTHDGDLIGTPVYMAPEQHARRDADARADQYAWCVAFYEAIFGERPFVGADLEQLGARKLAGIGPLPTHTPAKRRVPGWMRAILRRGLAADRERRHATMGELIAAIERGRARPRRVAWLAGVTIVAAGIAVVSLGEATVTPCPTPTPEGWEDFDRARIARVFAAVAPSYGPALAPWVGDSLAAVRERWRATHAEVCAATWVRGEQSAERLDMRMACLRRAWDRIAATTEIVQRADLEAVSHAVDLVADLPIPEACRGEAALRAAPRAGDDADGPRMTMMRSVEQGLARAHARRRIDRDAEAAAELDRVAPLVIELGEPRLQIEALLLRGRMLDDRGEPAQALENLREAAVSAKTIDAPLLEAEAWIALANAVGYTGHDFDEGRFYGGLALAAIERGDGGDQLQAWAETALGTIAFVAGEDARAEQLWRSALARRRALFPEPHHLIAASLNNLGGVAYAMGEHATAGDLLEQGMRMRETLFGPQHPSAGESAINLALVRVAQGRADEAIALCERALVVQEQAHGSEHPTVGRAHDALAGALESIGRYDAALAHADLAIAIYTAAWGKAHPAGHSIGLHRARSLLRLGRVAEGRAALESLLARFDPQRDAELRAEVQHELDGL